MTDQAHAWIQIVSIIGTVLLSFIFLLETANLIQQRHKLRANIPFRLTVLVLYGTTFFGLLCLVGVTIDWFSDWTGQEYWCGVFVKWVTVIIYLIMKQFILYFLFIRMKLVHDSLKLTHPFIRIIRWVVYLNIVVGIPFVFYPLGLIYFTGAVTADGFCIQYTTHLFPIAFFALADSLLSICLLILFIVPLTNHTRTVQGGKNQSVMKIARKNLIISSIMLLTTMGCLTYMSTASTVSSASEVSSQQIVTEILGTVDAFVNVLLCHCICGAWIPPMIKREGTTETASPQASGPRTRLTDTTSTVSNHRI